MIIKHTKKNQHKHKKCIEKTFIFKHQQETRWQLRNPNRCLKPKEPFFISV